MFRALNSGGGALSTKCRRLPLLLRHRRSGKRSLYTIGQSSDDDAESRTGFTDLDEDEDYDQPSEEGRRVVVVWDISTSRPPLTIDPYVAALRVLDIANAFGHVVDRAAYAEPPVPVNDSRPRTYYEEKFIESQYKPVWFQDAPNHLAEEYEYKCGYCGRKLRNHQSLYQHFKKVHATERTKRINQLNRNLKGQRRDEYSIAMHDKERKYQAALREIVMPRMVVNDALCSALTRAGFLVRLVTEKPLQHLFITAHESAIINHLWQAAGLNVACIVLLSDSCRFLDFVELSQQKGARFVGISDGYSELRSHVDLFVSWEEIERGRGYVWAVEAARSWFPDIRLFAKKSDLKGCRRLLRDCTEADYESS